MIRACILVGLLVYAWPAEATTYYVRTDGNNSNAGTTNSAAGAWLTIDKCADTMVAGDVCRVQAGSYVETATPGASGTSGNTITLVADGVVTTCGLNFSTARNYVRVIGFTFDRSLGGCSNSPVIRLTGTNTGLEFWNNDVGNLAGSGLITVGTTDRCNQCIVIGGAYHDFTDASGGFKAIGLMGDNIYIGYVDISNVCYIGIDPYGTNGRYINPYMHGLIQCGIYHPDFFYVDGAAIALGYSNSLVESAFLVGTPAANDNKIFHAENQSSVSWDDDVWRFNVVYNTGSASAFSMYSDSGGNTLTRWKFYNSTHALGSRATSSAVCGNVQNNGGGAITYSVYNSLYYECWATSQTTGILPWATTNPTADYNLGFDPDGAVTFAANWATQANEQTNVDPQLTDVGGLDFTLGSASPARGAGGPLTTATSCSGTTLNVAAGTGSFFIGDNSANLAAYGGALVPGDFLVVNGQTRQVVSRSTDALTLDASTTCSASDPVYFGDSTTIDIGAYPYKAGGYSLSATYTTSGGTATITPNDTSLVRFVVCYEDGIPTTVDNASPYTCSVGSGALVIRVYPRYASTTLYATATEVGASVAEPGGSRVQPGRVPRAPGDDQSCACVALAEAA